MASSVDITRYRGGGGGTLVRLNLKAVARSAVHHIDDCFSRTLPHYCRQQIAIINSRCRSSMKSHISLRTLSCTGRFDRSRTFCADVRWHGLAEAVSAVRKRGPGMRYGKNEAANGWATVSAPNWRI